MPSYTRYLVKLYQVHHIDTDQNYTTKAALKKSSSAILPKRSSISSSISSSSYRKHSFTAHHPSSKAGLLCRDHQSSKCGTPINPTNSTYYLRTRHYTPQHNYHGPCPTNMLRRRRRRDILTGSITVLRLVYQGQ